jgi:hypothetical protein
VLSTFREWNASFYGAKVRTVRLLKIDDLKILGELTRFPQFMECVKEYIPGYVFVLDQKKEPAALNILESFGYCPFAERSAKTRDRAPTDEWRKEFAIAWPAEGNVDYELKDDVDEATVLGERVFALVDRPAHAIEVERSRDAIMEYLR